MNRKTSLFIHGNVESKPLYTRSRYLLLDKHSWEKQGTSIYNIVEALRGSAPYMRSVNQMKDIMEMSKINFQICLDEPNQIELGGPGRQIKDA